jgi:hypothetical protein
MVVAGLVALFAMGGVRTLTSWVPQVRARYLGANPSASLRVGSGIRNTLQVRHLFSFPDPARSTGFNLDHPKFPQRVVAKATPLPVSCGLNQSALHEIAMQIAKFSTSSRSSRTLRS